MVCLAEGGKLVAAIEKRMAALAFLFKLAITGDMTKDFLIRQFI